MTNLDDVHVVRVWNFSGNIKRTYKMPQLKKICFKLPELIDARYGVIFLGLQ